MSQDQDATQVAPVDPSAAHANVPVDHDPNIDIVEMKLHFREDKALGTKRESVEIKLPIPSVEGIAKIYNEGGKGLQLLQACILNLFQDHARSIVNDDPNITSANFPYEKATWEAIVNMPESERKGRGIAKETWEEFGKDYIDHMPQVTGKSVDQVTNAAKLLVAKFQPVKTDKKVLAVLKNYLAVYLNQTPNAEQYIECVKFLSEKVDTLLAAEEKVIADYL